MMPNEASSSPPLTAILSLTSVAVAVLSAEVTSNAEDLDDDCCAKDEEDARATAGVTNGADPADAVAARRARARMGERMVASVYVGRFVYFSYLIGALRLLYDTMLYFVTSSWHHKSSWHHTS